ncbi:MAG: Ig-like domain-containing protein [Deltaproteobacteria bacterium]|nr:Ig-like domain-containing protein [Deltaproteobacteria bacterium]
MASTRRWYLLALALLPACGADPTPPLATAEPGVVFTAPADRQIDVPLGTRVVVTFSDPIAASALGPCSGSPEAPTGGVCLVGPNGVVRATATVTPDGTGAQLEDVALEPGTTYAVHVARDVAPTAQNLPAPGPLFSFTTRSTRPRAAAPRLVAFNGGDPAAPESFRPMFDTSTIRLVFSEPLDPRTVALAPGSVELVDANNRQVPATVIASGIHVVVDPVDDLDGGGRYTLRLGAGIADLGGQALAPQSIEVTARDTRGVTGAIPQVLRTRGAGDPGPKTSRAGAPANVIAIVKPLIGREAAAMLPSAVAASLGDPKVLGGPIAFTIRRGQRLHASGLDVKLGGDIPVGLSTGDIEIELLTDGGGRIYRNPHQPDDQRPENERAPLYVDLSLDVAVYAVDPGGNAVLTQTVLGLQATGTATAADGVLAIETVASMDLGLLGVTSAPSNLVLELITDASATAPTDTTPPSLVATFPADGTAELPVDGGIELIFDEPIDLDLARAGGIRLENAQGQAVASVIESHGAAVVVRPLARLPYSQRFRVLLSDVADVAGNRLATVTVSVATPALASTGAPLTVAGIHPGVPCALNGGRCVGGLTSDQPYRPFTLPADEPIEIAFTQPITPGTITLGAACGTGSVRIEELSGAGTCVAAVAGTLMRRDRLLTFVPDAPWVEGRAYRITLVSGNNRSCNAGELCGPSGDAASFDPLNGMTGGDAGGPALAIDFVGAPRSGGTYMFAQTAPFTDQNGSGTVDGVEIRRDENRAALRIKRTTGDVSNARFETQDCIPSTPEVEACLYLGGAMPVTLGEVESGCTLPGGATAARCVPVQISPAAMYGTSVAMHATAIIGIDTDTGTAVMRVREPAGGGTVTGYIVDDNGTPTLVVALDLYMDAPDMSIPLSDHDLHSKQLSVTLKGPVSFLPDGRIAISVANVAEVPVTVAIDAPLGVGGTVEMVVPAGEMKLQLLSNPLRGVSR